MGNIHTLNNLNVGNSTTSTVLINENSVNDGTQLIPVLKLRAGESEVLRREVESALDRFVKEHKKYNEENGSSSMAESFPDLYPSVIEEEISVPSLFDIIQNIYKNFQNSDIDVNEDNINNLSDLIKKDSSSGNLTFARSLAKARGEGVLSILSNISKDLTNNLQNNGLKPLGSFGDITLNDLIIKSQNLDFSFLINNREITIYPLKFISAGLVYGTIVRLYMKHCDDHKAILEVKDLNFRRQLLRIRRVNIAITLGLTAPLATILLVKFGKLSLFDGIKFTKGNIENNKELLNYIPILISTLKKKNPKFFNFLKLNLFIIFIWLLYKYNIIKYIINFINLYFLIYLWFLGLIFSILYNSVGYFIFINKNEVNIDLKKIKIKFIRNILESFITIRNSNIDKEWMKKYFLSHLYMSLFVIIISGILILI